MARALFIMLPLICHVSRINCALAVSSTPNSESRNVIMPTQKYLDNPGKLCRIRATPSNATAPSASSATAPPKFHAHTPFSYLARAADSACHTARNVYLVVFVQSAVHHELRRNTIRATWASLAYGFRQRRVDVVFVLGRSENARENRQVREESRRHGDIVQANFVDTYWHLTEKHLVALHWVHHYCPSARYILKLDDDTFVNMENLLMFLMEYEQRPRNPLTHAYMIGLLRTRELPLRSRNSKWYMPWRTFPFKHYPDHLKGFGYVFTRAAVEPLLGCAYYNAYLYIDDIFISGVVAESASVARHRFHSIYEFAYSRGTLISHELNNYVLVINRNDFSESFYRMLWYKSLENMHRKIAI